MTDLTKPFFGNPLATAQGEKARKARLKPYETTWLDEFLRGMFGAEDPAGSLAESGALDADPIRAAAGEQAFAKKRMAGNVGQAAGIGLDLSSYANPVVAATGGVAALMGMSNLPKAIGKIGKQRGAIRVGGNPDLYVSHATNPAKLDAIVKAGYLDAPSLGVSAREANDFAKDNPQFIFRAGAVDPNKNIGTMVNRDGYFENPRIRGYDGEEQPEAFKREIARLLEGKSKPYNIPDLRLSQGWPGGGQSLAIAASPSFRSFEDYEKARGGARSLLNPDSRASTWQDIDNTVLKLAYKYDYASVDDYVKDLTRRALGKEDLLPGEPALWEQLKDSPSAMAEFKIYDKLGLNPNEAFMYLPKLPDRYDLRRQYEKLRDSGMPIITARELADPEVYDLSFSAAKKLADTVPPTGEFKLPPRLESGHPLRSHDYNRFVEFMDPKAGGGTPPLSVAPSPAVPSKVDPDTIPGLKPDVVEFLKYHDSPADAKKTIDDILEQSSLAFPDADEFYAAIAKAWPGFTPPKKLADVPKLAKKTNLDIGTLSTHSVFESSIPPGQKAQWEQILANADEYGYVAEEAFKKYAIDPAFVPNILDHLKHQQVMELHKQPGWHDKLDKIIGATWGGMTPSK